MANKKVVGTLVVLLVPLAFAFNNCGQVNFEDVSEKASSLDADAQEAAPLPIVEQQENAPPILIDPNDVAPVDPPRAEATPPSVEEPVVMPSPEPVVEQPVPQPTPVPVSELERDPSLFDIYKCPDSDGVLICHYPENVKSLVTQCVGRSAAKTHFDHVRTYREGGESKTVSDYLGPCRSN